MEFVLEKFWRVWVSYGWKEVLNCTKLVQWVIFCFVFLLLIHVYSKSIFFSQPRLILVDMMDRFDTIFELQSAHLATFRLYCAPDVNLNTVFAKWNTLFYRSSVNAVDQLCTSCLPTMRRCSLFAWWLFLWCCQSCILAYWRMHWYVDYACWLCFYLCCRLWSINHSSPMMFLRTWAVLWTFGAELWKNWQTEETIVSIGELIVWGGLFPVRLLVKMAAIFVQESLVTLSGFRWIVYSV